MTIIHKGIHGWIAETSVPLNGNRQLRFHTMKRSNGAVSTAVQCVKQEPGGFSFVVFQDFNARVLSESGRATEKFVADQHQRALAMLDDIKAACERHYTKEPA